MNLTRNIQPVLSALRDITPKKYVHVSAALNRVNVQRYKPTPRKDYPLSYDMAMLPHHIASRKAWNSWNTSNLKGGARRPETLIEDAFIRDFMNGVFTNMIASELIIKRQYNMIRITGFLDVKIPVGKLYFLYGFTEELLSRYFHCNVKLELVTIDDPEKLVYRYV